MSKLSNMVVLDPDGNDIPSEVVLNDEKHILTVEIDVKSRVSDVYFKFSSREAMYEFAKSIMYEAVFGKSEPMEFYPLVNDGKCLVVNGVRLTEGSPRMFMFYPS